MSDTNFDFLDKFDKRVARLAKQAEQYVHTDPDSCMFKLRLMVETMAKKLTSLQMRGDISKDLGAMLGALERSGIVPRRQADSMHAIRRDGNAAVRLDGEHGGSAIFLGFPAEALPEESQMAFMNAVIGWLGESEPTCPADCNGDGVIDVNDLLAIIGSWGMPLGCDINGDGMTNVLDIVGMVNIILDGPPTEQLPVWAYEDINMNSDYFGEMIGPETFNGNVSLYYFGKAG